MTSTDTERFFRDFGVCNIKVIGGGSEFVADCPFCGDPKHFYFNKECLYNCKKCHEKGNAITYLREKHNKNGEIHEILKEYGLNNRDYVGKNYQKNNTHNKSNGDIRTTFDEYQELINKHPDKLRELAQIRKFKNVERSIELMKQHKFCIDHLGNYIIPFFNFDGSVRGLQRYHPEGVIKSVKETRIERHLKEDGSPMKAMLMKGHKSGLFGFQVAYNNSEIQIIIICESPLKALHMQIQGFDGVNAIGNNREKILAVGVVGAGNLPMDQVEFFHGRNVEFLYDSDFKNETSMTITVSKEP